jgi:hypothetical protein
MPLGVKAGMHMAQIISSQVVPLLDRLLITMSPGRNPDPSQRALSACGVR